MDTLIFVLVAFYGEFPLKVLLDMIIGLTALKLSFIPLNITAIYMTRKNLRRKTSKNIDKTKTL